MRKTFGFYRLSEIIGNKSRSRTGSLIPLSRSAWLAGVKAGTYPKPIKLSARKVAWRVEEINDLIDRLGA